ncbi:MAG: Parvulin PPIase [Rickettsiaceae bacterium]|nr:MAG: Parvulin PPIase [Rickettsiaceae bacterium]
MNKLAIIFLSASLLSSVALADDNTILATYKGGEVKESQVMQQYKPLLDMNVNSKDKKFSELDTNLQEQLVTAYVRSKLLYQEASNQGIEKSADFQEKLNKTKVQLLEQEVIERYIKNNINDKMIDEEFTKQAAILKGQKEPKVSHIFIKSSNEAIKDKAAEEKVKQIEKQLSAVEDKKAKSKLFTTLVKKYSDDEASKNNGGNIGFVVRGQFVPEFEAQALSMKVGEISEPIKTSFGWHIIKVVEERDVKVPSKEEAKNGITNRLSNDAILKYLTELMKNSDVKITMPKKEEQKPSDNKSDAEKNKVAPAA